MLRGSDRNRGKYPYTEVMEIDGRLRVWNVWYVMEKKKKKRTRAFVTAGKDRVKIT